MEMFGAILKTYYCKKNKIDPEKIFVVAVMPCTSKKFEASRPEMADAGFGPDIDVSITTRELARMIKSAGIDFAGLDDEHFDQPFGDATGAGVIFGATGGVMEAALRTVSEVLEGKTIENVEYTAVRGTDAIKEATLNVAGMDVNICVVSGLDAAHKVLTAVEKGEKNYHFIEIMCCPGGCVNGGGQPIQPNSVRQTVDIKALRAQALYDYDAANQKRKSHESPVVKALYDEYFEKPGSHKAHKILHTSYVDRSKNVMK